MPDGNDVHASVRDKYRLGADASRCGLKYPIGRAGMHHVGYPPERAEWTTDELAASYCGVGDPFACGGPRPGAAVLDIGCGGGSDLAIAERLTGAGGRGFGVELTPELAAAAQRNLGRAGCARTRIAVGCAERLPCADRSFDLVLANGVFHWSVRKERCLGEARRTLRPGGRIQFADIVLSPDAPAAIVARLAAWSS